MGFRNWLTKNASKTAETVIVQAKENMQKNIETNVIKKGNALFTIGKLVVLGIIFVLASKDGDSLDNLKLPESTQKMPNITINNYMNERRQEND